MQWQPLLCRPTASLFAAPGAEWLILGRKAEGLRSSVCQWCAEPGVWWVGGGCELGGCWFMLCSTIAGSGLRRRRYEAGGRARRAGGHERGMVTEARWPREARVRCLLDRALAHLIVLWVVVAGLAVAGEAVLAGGEALTVQLQAARVAAVARLAQLRVLVLSAAPAWRGWRAAFARQPRRAGQEGGLALGGRCRLTAGGCHEEKEGRGSERRARLREGLSNAMVRQRRGGKRNASQTK